MRTTIDAAGRLVIPKSLRDRVGINAGEVEVVAEGSGIRVEPVAQESLAEKKGRMVVPATGERLDDETVEALRDADHR